MKWTTDKPNTLGVWLNWVQGCTVQAVIAERLGPTRFEDHTEAESARVMAYPGLFWLGPLPEPPETS